MMMMMMMMMFDVGMFRMLVVWMKIRESCCCGWEMTHAADNAHYQLELVLIMMMMMMMYAEEDQ